MYLIVSPSICCALQLAVQELGAQLSGWLSKASVTVKGTVRAIIGECA